ncbi:MAG: hypothetical protein SPG97_04820 [Bacilli bacterium]|nr:hypothetical protein [Bacilli bacterium]
MFFTREDIDKIQQGLLSLGVKDSELPEVNNITNSDTLAIVQDGKNKQINIIEFFNNISLFKREAFINITDRFNKPSISLIDAIQLVPIHQRINGLVITFEDVDKNWRIYQFRGNKEDFFKEDKWLDLYDYTNWVVDSITPDEEDLTVTTPDKNGNALVHLKDRAYDKSNFSGKGYKILRKNIQTIDGVRKNILNSNMISEPNTIYEIRYDFDLNDAEITIPENCVLKFNGGSLSNGTINGNYAKIEAETLDNILINIKYISPVNFNRNLTYYIMPEIWGIIEGYIEKGEDGHYTEEQYDIMYNNGVGFTKAIEYASNKGFNKVVFPKGKYCFTPFDSTVKYRISNSIWIHDLYNFDIDLNSSELYFLIDSTQKSKYVTFDYDYIWDIRGSLIGISTCENLNIHNGVIIGDRLIRTYTDEKEKWAEQTYGISLNGININIKISDIDVSNFMGDGISASMNNMVQVDYKVNIVSRSTDNLLRKKSEYLYYIKDNKIVNDLGFKQEGSSITDFIDTDLLITDNYLKHNLLKRYRKSFRLAGNGGYTRLANCYCPKIDVLVYDGNSESSKVIRIIPCSFLEDFQLYDYERYIKLQFIKDFDIPVEGITSNLVVTVKGAEGLIIENCYIHNNHRGNFSGSINNTTIRKCIFEKALTYNQGVGIIDYPDSTNYHINIEDSFCRKVTVYDCDFKGVAKAELLFGCYDLSFYNNRCNQMPGIYSNIFSDIYNNIFKVGSTFNINSTIVAKNTVGGGSKLQRHIAIHNNYIYSLEINNVYLDRIKNTTVSFNDNTCFMRYQLLLGFNTSVEAVAKYVIENNSFIATNNRIFFCTDEYTYFVVMGRWTNNYFLNKFGPFDRYKKIIIAGEFTNNIVELSECIIRLGEFRNNIITGQKFFNYSELVRNTENDYIYKIFSNITIKNLFINDSIASNSTIEFRDCDITIGGANSPMVSKDNSTLIFNRCNFNTDKKYIVAWGVVAKDKNCKLILKDCTLNNKSWPVDVVFSSKDKNPVCIKRGSSTQRPLYVEDDFLYYDTTLKRYTRWNGEEWVNSDGTVLG